tara:strand:- start:91 stop:345 length:255 start_codon:yes stop_codon:yes gene_type:complete
MEQGKRKDQIDFSSRMAFAGFIGITLCFIWAIGFLPKTNQPTEGIPHNYYHPKVWGDGVITKDTTNYTDEDVMWITGEGDTIWE